MKVLPAIVVAAGLLLAGAVASTITFEEIAGRSGLVFATDSSPTPNKNQPETMVAGVALIDYDRDGYLDIYLVNGAAIPSLKKESPKYWNRLFHNNRDGTFTDVTEKAGVAGEGYGMGVAVGDYDNDGRPDIFVANVTRNQLFRNNQDGTFTDVTDQARVGGGILDGKKMWSVSAGWLDYNNDGRLDLFVSNYCKWEVKGPVLRAESREARLLPSEELRALPNTLYHNNGDGTFTDVSAADGNRQAARQGDGSRIADYDRDGFTDVFVANDNRPTRCSTNRRKAVRGSGLRKRRCLLARMPMRSPAWEPISRTYLQRRPARTSGTPRPRTSRFRLSEPGRGRFLGGDQPEPVDADAHYVRMVEWDLRFRQRRMEGPFRRPRKRARQRGGFLEPHLRGAECRLSQSRQRQVSGRERRGRTRLSEAAPHRGAAFGDIDNDGRIDAVVTVLNGRAKYFHNVTRSGNHWILLKLVGTKSNRMGIGAQIRITGEDGSKQSNEVTTACGYAGASDSRVHFGLGESRTIREIDIQWPSRIHQVLRNVAADQILTVEERAGEDGGPAKGR